MGSAALAAGISATAATAGSATSAAVSGKMNKRTLKFNKWALEKQREWSLQDTADQRAYNEQLYEKYNSPKAQAQQYADAGYSKLAALDGNGSWTINPVQSMNNSDTSSFASNVGNANSQYAANMSSAAQQASAGIGDAALQFEQIRSLRLDNDQKDKQYNADNQVLDLEVSKRDFPQLHGYDQDWFDDFSEKLGHPVTLRDMLSAAVAKQVVHSANAAAGHVHDWKSGAEYNAVVGHMNDQDDFFSYDVDSNDSLLRVLMQMFDNSVNDSNNQTALNQLKQEYEQFRKDNQAWITELEKQKNDKTMSDVNVEWQIVEKWLSAIGTGSEAFANIFGNFNIGKILSNLLTRSRSGSSSRTNYKPKSTSHGKKPDSNIEALNDDLRYNSD